MAGHRREVSKAGAESQLDALGPSDLSGENLSSEGWLAAVHREELWPAHDGAGDTATTIATVARSVPPEEGRCEEQLGHETHSGGLRTSLQMIRS